MKNLIIYKEAEEFFNYCAGQDLLESRLAGYCNSEAGTIVPKCDIFEGLAVAVEIIEGIFPDRKLQIQQEWDYECGGADGINLSVQVLDDEDYANFHNRLDLVKDAWFDVVIADKYLFWLKNISITDNYGYEHDDSSVY